MADLYEWFAAPGLRDFHRQVACDVASTLTRGRVLDVGTGPGRLLAEIAGRRGDLELVGVDLSRRMLAIARKRVERAGAPADRRPVRLVRADVRELPFADGAFDMVVSTLSLHHWRDVRQGLSECLRVTAAAGECWIYDLRTDARPAACRELLTGGTLARWARCRVFKWHGVDPADYESPVVAGWLDDAADVQTEVHEAYLRLRIRNVVHEPSDAIGPARPEAGLVPGTSATPP